MAKGEKDDHGKKDDKPEKNNRLEKSGKAAKNASILGTSFYAGAKAAQTTFGITKRPLISAGAGLITAGATAIGLSRGTKKLSDMYGEQAEAFKKRNNKDAANDTGSKNEPAKGSPKPPNKDNDKPSSP